MANLPTVGGSAGSWGATLNAFLSVAHKSDGTLADVNNVLHVINVKDPLYGAKGDGTTDDTDAIQAAINAATGASNPASTTRTPTAPVYLPPGTYKVTSDLIIRSVSGFKLIGAGIAQVTILASGTGFTQAVLFVNGSLDGLFEGFAVQGDGTEQVNDGIRLDWVTASRTDPGCVTNSTTLVTNTGARTYDVGATITGSGIPGSTTVVSVVPGVSWTLSHSATASATVTLTVASLNAAARSTTGNRFRDIRVRALKFITGISLTGNSSVQVDGTVFDNVVVTGGQTPGSWSSSGNWQNGFTFGNGVYANNYDHVQTGCGTALCYYGWKINASSLDLDGSQPAANFCDFWVLTNGQTSIKNIQSQGSGQFITSPSSFPPEANTVEDVLFTTFNPNAGYPVATLNGGMWVFSNFSVGFIYASSAYQTGIFAVTGQNSSRPCIATFDNLTVTGAKTSAFTVSNADVSVRNYHNYNPATGNYTAPVAGDLLSLYTGGAWLSLDQAPTATPSSAIEPVDIGSVAWNCPPARYAGSSILTNIAGQLATYLLKSGAGGSVTKILYTTTAAGTGLANCFLGVYDSTGTLVGQCTTDQTTNMQASGGTKTATLSTTVTLSPNSLYYVGMVLGTVSTYPTMAIIGPTTTGSMSTMGTSGAAKYSAGSTGSALSALPGSFTPSSRAGLSGGICPVFVLQ